MYPYCIWVHADPDTPSKKGLKPLMKSRCCAFVGQRPITLPWGYDEEHPSCEKLKSILYEQVRKLCRRGVTEFMTGMSLGVESYGAETVLKIKRSNPHIRLICVLPSENQADKWTVFQRARYFDTLAVADEVIYISRQHTDSCITERNDWILKHADLFLAVYSADAGHRCTAMIQSIKTTSKELISINPKNFRMVVSRNNLVLIENNS